MNRALEGEFPIDPPTQEEARKFGRFGHCQDPVQDYLIEVEWLDGAVTEAEIGVRRPRTAEQDEVASRMVKAMNFTVGGNAEAVSARRALVDLRNRLKVVLDRSPIDERRLDDLLMKLSPDARHAVPDMLEGLASLYRARGAVYGDNYLHAGEVLMGLFPRGLHLKTAAEFNRFHLVVHLASKLSRYCMSMELKGEGHEDSLNDMAVYSQMLRESDALAARQP